MFEKFGMVSGITRQSIICLNVYPFWVIFNHNFDLKVMLHIGDSKKLFKIELKLNFLSAIFSIRHRFEATHHVSCKVVNISSNYETGISSIILDNVAPKLCYKHFLCMSNWNPVKIRPVYMHNNWICHLYRAFKPSIFIRKSLYIRMLYAFSLKHTNWKAFMHLEKRSGSWSFHEHHHYQDPKSLHRHWDRHHHPQHWIIASHHHDHDFKGFILCRIIIPILSWPLIIHVHQLSIIFMAKHFVNAASQKSFQIMNQLYQIYAYISLSAVSAFCIIGIGSCIVSWF